MTRGEGADLQRVGMELSIDAVGITTPRVLAESWIVGGAVYDALVGLVAGEHVIPPGTRDAHAPGMCGAVGVRVELVGG